MVRAPGASVNQSTGHAVIGPATSCAIVWVRFFKSTIRRSLNCAAQLRRFFWDGKFWEILGNSSPRRPLIFTPDTPAALTFQRAAARQQRAGHSLHILGGAARRVHEKRNI